LYCEYLGGSLAIIIDEHNQKAIEMFLDTADPSGVLATILSSLSLMVGFCPLQVFHAWIVFYKKTGPGTLFSV
jgi:hypothetical protein